jgi:hypothetical protein
LLCATGFSREETSILLALSSRIQEPHTSYGSDIFTRCRDYGSTSSSTTIWAQQKDVEYARSGQSSRYQQGANCHPNFERQSFTGGERGLEV